MPSRDAFAFGPYHLDPQSRRLTRGDTLVRLTPRPFDLLLLFVTRAGEALSKDVLIREAWRDVAVTDNNLIQIVRQLRVVLDPKDPERYIRTESRDGYRFVEPVTRIRPGHTDADLDAVLAHYRARLDGRLALETLALTEIARARTALEPFLATHGDDASLRITLANACALQFEGTRADAEPDRAALQLASVHAREGCRLSLDSAEAWATLAFVLARLGHHADALAAYSRALALEPDNWRHLFRLAGDSWGEECLRAARRVLALLPGYPMAHLLAARIYVGRGALADAEREVDCALAAFSADASSGRSRFGAVALYYLKGLLCLARGADDEARAAFMCELALEARGHVYTRECCANTWYAIGALEWRLGDRAAARRAFEQAIARVARHPMAHAGLAILDGRHDRFGQRQDDAPLSMELALARGVVLVAGGEVPGAVALVAAALASAPPGSAGWLVAIEPLLGVNRAAALWAPVLAKICERAY